MLNLIMKALKESAEVKLAMIDACASDIEHAAELIIASLLADGKLIIFGNGGSAADSQHLAAEIIGRFYRDRFPLPAIALTTDTSVLTAVANDYGFDKVFARQVKGLATPDDVVLGISTSGKSANVIEAFHEARKIGTKVIALTGEAGCPMDELADVCVKIPSRDTPRVQEGHTAVCHVLAMLVELKLSAADSPD